MKGKKYKLFRNLMVYLIVAGLILGAPGSHVFAAEIDQPAEEVTEEVTEESKVEETPKEEVSKEEAPKEEARAEEA